MLILDKSEVGEILLNYRNKAGLTQTELAEKAGVADRTYADIERGISNMRVDTLLKICRALRVTPNDVLIKSDEYESYGEEAFAEMLEDCSPVERARAYKAIELILK